MNSSDDEYYYYYDDEPNPALVLHVPAPYIVPLMGYVYPALALLTILTNAVIVTVFVRKMRTPTSVILVALALSDTLACACRLPSTIFLYTLQNYKTPVPFAWCLYHHYMVSDLYLVARTSSNWITVFLGLQRYVVVRFPFKARKICSQRNSVIVCLAACVIAVIVHLNHFMMFEVYPVPVMPKDNTTDSTGCNKRIPDFYIEAVGGTVDNVKTALTVYYTVSGVFSRILPCLILLISTVLLVRELRKGRKSLIMNESENKLSSKRTKQLNQFVVAILVIFLLSELHDAVAFAIYVCELSTDQPHSLLSARNDAIWDMVGAVISLVGFQCNFWIYLLMSAQFRSSLKNLCSSADRSPSVTETTLLSYKSDGSQALIKATRTGADKFSGYA